MLTDVGDVPDLDGPVAAPGGQARPVRGDARGPGGAGATHRLVTFLKTSGYLPATSQIRTYLSPLPLATRPVRGDAHGIDGAGVAHEARVPDWIVPKRLLKPVVK